MQPTESPGREELPKGYVENCIGTVTGTDPDVATTTADHGEPPWPEPGMKREPGTPREIQQFKKTRRRLTSRDRVNLHFRINLFNKVKCACRKVSRHCIDCDCLSKCSNFESLQASSNKDNDEMNDHVYATLKAINFQIECGDAQDRSNDADRDTVQPTPVDKVQDVMPVGDLPGATILPVDLMLMKVYGDYIHQNNDTHLDGGIEEDGAWQERWRRLIALPSQRYDAPSGAVGRHFVEILTEELEGICRYKWNSECFSTHER